MVYNRIVMKKVKYVEVACQWCGRVIERASVGPNFTCYTCKCDKVRLRASMRFFKEKELSHHKDPERWEDFLNACDIKKAQVARKRHVSITYKNFR